MKTFFWIFFAVYDSAAEKACKQISSLDMWHVSNPYSWIVVLPISNCSLASEDVVTVWGPILFKKDEDGAFLEGLN